ncbi:efflux transporter, outer membrane factor (OMF) lipoprotein, NodT family [Cyclobacterium lianum]|uniref:Efflux transporter, outer membrane factor (OMF) lipoprotein, NodT family n=1 Tax=Cyclobacterium lianum TaxID=388280 RepID=A0A1M7M2N7_9BACT|nr:efflux transporter outer membrane subunit [Cyclobacterium lianum]SHM84863.1 efflux transporter, outer membrane factor (OMF) lipoprotein, NodT family [Cyclobacterium lianum]
MPLKRLTILLFSSLNGTRLKSGLPTTLIILFLGVMTACGNRVTTSDLPVAIPENYTLNTGEEDLETAWWTSFGDTRLNALVDSALRRNLELQGSWYQVAQDASTVAIIASERVPQVFLELQGGASRPVPDFVGGENTQLSLRSSYEVDLWGRVKQSKMAAESRLKASYLDYQTLAISIAGEVAVTWFSLQAFQEQLTLIREQTDYNEQVLGLIRARFASGQVRGVDILRQEQLIQSTKEQATAIQIEIQTLQNRLAVLLGSAPGTISLSQDAGLPELGPLPNAGLPMELINRRPDIQSSFFQMEAADREVAVAISNTYPRLTFNFTGALRSNTLTNLVESQAASITSSLLMPLFYGGRLKAEKRQAEAFRDQQIQAYGQTVLLALQEVEDAMVRERLQRERIGYLEQQLKLAERAFQQLRVEYLNGSIAYLDVLVSLDQMQQLKRDLVGAELDQLLFRLALYRALAGGFETPIETGEGFTMNENTIPTQ